jgi:gamma-glutamyl-gamma-aminobutyrate hydrolase PuuD
MLFQGPKPRIGIFHDEGRLGYTLLRKFLEGQGAEVIGLSTAEEVQAWLPSLEGIVLPGGPDLDPASYGQTPHPNTSVTEDEPRRFAVESLLARHALEQALPILAVCRGMQLMNVVMGGSLIQHIPDVAPEEFHQDRRVKQIPLSRMTSWAELLVDTNQMSDEMHAWMAASGVPEEKQLETARALMIAAQGVATPVQATHHVELLSPDSLLARAARQMGDGKQVEVLSVHHQGMTLNELAPGIVPTAMGVREDGSRSSIVEAAELPNHPHAVMVQFHPEATHLIVPLARQLLQAVLRERDARGTAPEPVPPAIIPQAPTPLARVSAKQVAAGNDLVLYG